MKVTMHFDCSAEVEIPDAYLAKIPFLKQDAGIEFAALAQKSIDFSAFDDTVITGVYNPCWCDEKGNLFWANDCDEVIWEL